MLGSHPTSLDGPRMLQDELGHSVPYRRTQEDRTRTLHTLPRSPTPSTGPLARPLLPRDVSHPDRPQSFAPSRLR